MRNMLKSKIHRAHVTETNLEYEGSITVDQQLLEAADIIPYEEVQVLNVNNGARFSTYAITGKPGNGDICLNGAAARMAVKGDVVIILTYAQMEEEAARRHTPRVVHVDACNAIVASHEIPSAFRN
jgi:aspartate 1-decarboxylase